MTEQPAGPGDDAAEEPVVAWLDEIAEAEGLSREAAVEYLVSSYWQLKEVVDLLDLPEAESTRAESVEPIDPEAVIEALGDLSTRLESIEAAIGADRSDEPATDAVVTDPFEAFDSRLAALEAHMGELDDRLTALDASTVSSTALDAHVDQAATYQEAITRQHDTLRTRVITEFDHIRTILTYLLETGTANEARIDDLVDEFDQPLRTLLTERKRLEAITRSAIHRGIETAACEQCDRSVDLAMLRAPRCPSCDHPFAGLETRQRLFGLVSSYVLTDTV